MTKKFFNTVMVLGSACWLAARWGYPLQTETSPIRHQSIFAGGRATRGRSKSAHPDFEVRWYAQRRRNPEFRRCAMLFNAQISGMLAATQKLTYDFVVHTTLGLCLA